MGVRVVMVAGPRESSITQKAVVWLLRHLFPAEEGVTYVLRQGGAEGVDTMAKVAASLLGWAIEADWKPKYKIVPMGYDTATWKKVAPLKRTEDMLDGKNGPMPEDYDTYGLPPSVLVVVRDTPELPKGGTGHAVREARKRGIPIIVFEIPPKEAESVSREAERPAA